jgi:hypothetical protein
LMQCQCRSQCLCDIQAHVAPLRVTMSGQDVCRSSRSGQCYLEACRGL